MPMSPRLLRPRQTGFTPRSISGLALWLDAADSQTLYQDAAATIPATATNDPVGAWLDKSGNGRHATQATAASRPTVGSIASGRGLVFDSHDSLLSLASVADIIGSPASSPATTIAFVALNSSGAAGFTLGSDNAANGRVLVSNSFDASGGSFFDVAGTAGGRLAYSLPASSQTAASVYLMQRNGSSMVVRRNGATIATKSDASQTFSATTARLSLGQTIGLTGFSGTCGSVLCYPSAISSADRQRIERYLAAKWGITLAPQVSNADAQDWVNRVYANGGTVSTATATAVNTFCTDIENAGIRDRFYRLNLFAGNSDASLNAVRTPLFRGPSLTGTQYGNAIDTNVNFVQGDYSESVGLNANGSVGSSSKYLDTATANNSLPSVATGHLSVFRGPFATGGVTTFGLIGTRIAVSHIYEIRQTGVELARGLWGGSVSAQEGSGNTGRRLLLATRTASNSLTLYGNAVALATSSSSVTPSAVSDSFLVFNRRNADGSVDASQGFPGVISAYSVGEGMTAAQVASYHTALTAFLAALGRATT
jgi:hypothetical protein